MKLRWPCLCLRRQGEALPQLAMEISAPFNFHHIQHMQVQANGELTMIQMFSSASNGLFQLHPVNCVMGGKSSLSPDYFLL
eukprot:scaffold5387_cov251-Ochromonas_danica.AAC.24